MSSWTLICGVVAYPSANHHQFVLFIGGSNHVVLGQYISIRLLRICHLLHADYFLEAELKNCALVGASGGKKEARAHEVTSSNVIGRNKENTAILTAHRFFG